MTKPRDGSLMGRVMKRLQRMEEGAALSSIEISDEFDVALSSVRPCLAPWVAPGWLFKERRGTHAVYGLAAAEVPEDLATAGDGDGDGDGDDSESADLPFNCALYLDGDLVLLGDGVEQLQDGGVLLRPAAVAAMRSYLAATSAVPIAAALHDPDAVRVPVFGAA